MIATPTGRRSFTSAVSAVFLGASLGLALPAHSQPVVPRVVWLSAVPESQGGPFFGELRAGLLELGYVDGRNIRLESRWADGTGPSVDKLITDTLAGNPTLIVSLGSVGPLLRKAATSLPVVFGYSGDPVEAGMIDSRHQHSGSQSAWYQRAAGAAIARGPGD